MPAHGRALINLEILLAIYWRQRTVMVEYKAIEQGALPNPKAAWDFATVPLGIQWGNCRLRYRILTFGRGK